MPRAVGFPALIVREMPSVGTLSVDLLAAFETFRSGSYPWLLDSGAAPGVPSEQLARYSFAGSDPYAVLRGYGNRSEFTCLRAIAPSLELGTEEIQGDPLEVMRALLPEPESFAAAIAQVSPAPPFLTGAVGYFGYELGASCEPVCSTGRDDFGLADLVLLLVDRLLVVDHLLGRSYAVGLGFGKDAEEAHARADEAAFCIEEALHQSRRAGRPAGSTDRRREFELPRRDQVLAASIPKAAEASLGEAAYREAVERIREEIAKGEVYQTNITQRIDLPSGGFTGDQGLPLSDADLGWKLYRALRYLSPAPFAAYIELPEVTIASSSPERFLALDRSGRVESRPIKGTRRRGNDAAEDAQLAKELGESEKDRAENLMIVDLVRNDLGRVCEIASVEVPELMSIETYATVFQLVSTVRGQLRSDCDRTDLIRATYPPGSMTGAPKIAAMKLIDRLEQVRRGIYSGAIGYLDAAGGLDLSVAIRTLLVRDGEIHLHSGGAVVSDSDPAAEYRESLDKIRALLAAVECVR